MLPERAVKIWKPLYLHFTTKKYDCISSENKVKYTQEEIEKKSKQLIKYSKLFDKNIDAAFFLIANYIDGNFDVPFIIIKDNIDTYVKWKGRRESITYLFKQEFNIVLDNITQEDYCSKYPQDSELFQMYLQKKISPETLILIDKYHIEFLNNWFHNDIHNLFYNNILRLIKYRPFVKHDVNKIKEVITALK